MAKKVAIILTNEFEDIELTSPKEAIEEAGHETVVIGDQANSEVVGKHGTKVAVDVSIADAKPEDFDGLLIPGGFSPDHLRGDAEGRYGTFAKYFTKNDVPTFAICHGHSTISEPLRMALEGASRAYNATHGDALSNTSPCRYR